MEPPCGIVNGECFPMPSWRLHTAALILFAGIVVIWMWPVLRAPAAAIPGAGAGDSFVYVWNLWWTKRSVLAGVTPFWSPMLFAPFGVNLTLHTHTLLATVPASLFFRDVIAGTNAIICAHLFLNFLTTYALAWRATRDWPAALLAAMLVGWSPYLTEHLPGHFNYIPVWVLSLSALLTLETRAGSRVAAPLLGLVLAATAYQEYYYAVYAAVLVVVLNVPGVFTLFPSGARPAAARYALRIVAVLIAGALLVAALVWTSGGTVWRAGGLTISMRSAGNAIAAAWLLSLVAAALAVAMRVRIRFDPRAAAARLRQLAPAVAIAFVLALPLVVAGARMMMSGDYVSQHYFWRSAPRGVDLATLVTGNLHGLIWSDGPLRTYARLGIDEMEQTVWLTPAAIVLCAMALYLGRRDRGVRVWMWAALPFAVWALGPYVAAFGRTLPLPLPATLIRYVPIVANARIPARAIVVVYLCVAMLASFGFVLMRTRHRRWALVLAALAIVDLLPARPVLFTVERPRLYGTLRQQQEAGAVCELPMGLRDGFGEVGRLDTRVMFFQSLHDRPITGGFVSRLPPRTRRAYEDDPVLGVLLRLSGGQPLSAERPLSPPAAADALERQGIRFVVVNSDTAPPDLLRYVSTGLPLRPLDREGPRTLYEMIRD